MNTNARTAAPLHKPLGVSPRQIFGSVLMAATLPALLAVEFWRTRSERYRQWLLTLFMVVLGFVVIIEAGDALDHLMDVELVYSSISFELFLNDLWRILTFQITETGTKDVYKHIVGYFFGGILGMPQLFFPFVAGVYGYFFAGSILHVLRHFSPGRANYVVFAFVFVFLMLKGVDGYLSVRTWTGLWILVYACLKYHEQPRLRYLLLMFVPPFIHLGYFLLAIPAWIVLIFGSRPLAYVVIFALSSVTTILPQEQITQQISRTERGAAQVQGYYTEEQDSAIEEFMGQRQQTNFYNAYRRAGLQRWAPTVLVITLLACGMYLKWMTRYQKRIFSIGLLTLAFSNATWFLFAVHNRSLTIAMVFILAAFLMTRLDPRTRDRFQGLPGYYKWGLHLSLLLFAPLIMFLASMVIERYGFYSLGAPFMALVEPGSNVDFKQAIRFLLGRG
jgi:hypothetical protein